MKRLSLLTWKLLQWMTNTELHSFAVDQNYRPWSQKDGEPPRGKVYFHNAQHFTRAAEEAALELIARGWVDANQYGYYLLNTAGLKAAAELPRPEWKPPAKPKLTDTDYDVLYTLGTYPSWATSLDCGGRDQSHHSASLTKLVRHGYAELYNSKGPITGDDVVPEPRLTKRAKGSRKFRITNAGKEALEHVNETT